MRTFSSFCTILVLLLSFGLRAQTTVNNYQVAVSTQSLQFIAATSGTSISTFGNSDDAIYDVSLPFTFTFNGETFASGTNMKVSDNGYVLFGSQISSPNSTVYSPLSNHVRCISAFGPDLRGGVATNGTSVLGSNAVTCSGVAGFVVGEIVNMSGFASGTTILSINTSTNTLFLSNSATSSVVNSAIYSAKGNIRSEVRGTAPNRQFVIQWSSYSLYYSLSLPSTFPNFHNTFQIILHESGGVSQNQSAQIIYGLCQTSSVSATTSAQVGIKGSLIEEVISMGGTFANLTTLVGMVTSQTIGSSNVPVQDRSIVFTPIPNACTGAPVAGTTSATSQFLCGTTPKSITFSLTGAATTGGINYQWQSSSNGNTYTDIPTATSSTLTSTVSSPGYYRCRLTCSFGGANSTSTPVFIGSTPVPTISNISGPVSGVVYDSLTYTLNGTASPGIWQYSTDFFVFTSFSGSTQSTLDFLPTQAYNPIYIRYAIPASGGCLTYSSNVISTVITIPYNNVCNAEPLTVGANGPFTNVGATTQVGEVIPPASGRFNQNGWLSATIQNTTWFTFTVPATGSRKYRITTSTTNEDALDTELALYTADSCGALLNGLGYQFITANDDSSSLNFSSILDSALVCLIPGQTYYLQMDGYGGSDNDAIYIIVEELSAPVVSISGLPTAVLCTSDTYNYPLVGSPVGGVFTGGSLSCVSDTCTITSTLAEVGANIVTYAFTGLNSCYRADSSFTVLPTQMFYFDADGDTYGNPTPAFSFCTAPSAQYVLNNTDCNDADAAVNVAAIEICDVIDNDCDNLIDNNDPSITGQSTWYYDNDNDGFGGSNIILSCAQPTNTFATSTDCNDASANISPTATEICDNIDNDCDELTDDQDTNVSGQSIFFVDADADGFGRNDMTTMACSLPAGYSATCDDCNDNNANINPSKAEINNSLDDDCSGVVNDYCLNLSNPLVVFTTSSSVSIVWAPVNDAILYNVLYRAVGATTWSSAISNFRPFVEISGLAAGVSYEIRYRTKCPSGFTPYVTGLTFTMPSGTGNCTRPVKGADVVLSPFATTVFWNYTPNAVRYRIRYRVMNQTPIVWTTKLIKVKAPNTLVAKIGLQGLLSGTSYLYQVQALCPGAGDNWTQYSSLDTISTPFAPCQQPNTQVNGLMINEENNAFTSSDLMVWPNPAGDKVSIGALDFENVPFQILDIQGRQIESGTIERESVTLSTAQLPAGIYVVKAAGQIQRLVIQR